MNKHFLSPSTHTQSPTANHYQNIPNSSEQRIVTPTPYQYTVIPPIPKEKTGFHLLEHDLGSSLALFPAAKLVTQSPKGNNTQNHPEQVATDVQVKLYPPALPHIKSVTYLPIPPIEDAPGVGSLSPLPGFIPSRPSDNSKFSPYQLGPSTHTNNPPATHAAHVLDASKGGGETWQRISTAMRRDREDHPNNDLKKKIQDSLHAVPSREEKSPRSASRVTAAVTAAVR